MEIGLLISALVFAAGAFQQASEARRQTDRTISFLESLERRIILLQKDAVSRLIERGMDPQDAQFIHDIMPPFRESEEHLRMIFRR